QLTEIEAPPFKEEKRAKVYLEMLRQHGLTNVEMDAEGNVMGIRKGTGGGPLVAIAAHLDTVFPEGTDVKVKRNGTVLAAPGIGDDTRSLAVLLSILRAMEAAKIQTTSDILFIGDVGEEGQGDLRGMKYLFQKGPYKDKIKMFMSMEGGASDRLTNGGVGSKRYRVTFKGLEVIATAPLESSIPRSLWATRYLSSQSCKCRRIRKQRTASASSGAGPR